MGANAPGRSKRGAQNRVARNLTNTKDSLTNERRSSLSQQNFDILVANFLGNSYCIIKPPPPLPPKKIAGGTEQKQRIAPNPIFFSGGENFIAYAPGAGRQ